MKKQTTDEENMDMDIVPDIVSFNLGWDTCQKQQKNGYEQGYANALADVEKKIEKCVEPDTGLIFIGDLKQEIAKIHSQKQAKQLQEGKFDIISQTAFELKCSPDNDPNANKGEGK